MNRKGVFILLIAGCVLAAGITSVAVAVSSGKEAGSGASPGVTTDALSVTSISYYDRGGVEHPITLSQTYPGPSYAVAPTDVIIKAKASFSGSGGYGFVMIYDCDTSINWASKLIPSGKTVTVQTPIAMYVSSSIDRKMCVCVMGPGGSPDKYYYFQFT